MAKSRYRYSLSPEEIGLLSGVIGGKIMDLERYQRALGEDEGRAALIADLKALKARMTAPFERLRKRYEGGHNG